MADVVALKKLGHDFKSEVQQTRVKWDFAVDGGATGALNLFTASNDVIIKSFYAIVKTAATSGGSATLAAGVTGSTTKFFDATAGAVANLTANAVLSLALVPFRLPSGDSILQTIGTAAMTAGVVEYVIEHCEA